MIRSLALSLAMTATLAVGVAPAYAQGGYAGGSGSTCSSDDIDCRPPGGGDYEGGRPSGDVPEDPGYYRPDPRPPRPHQRPPHVPGPPPGYYRPVPPPDYSYSERLSCREARSILRSEGFRRVEAVDCQGSRYRFEAVYRGRPVLVTMSSRSGRIIDVSRI